MAKVIGLEGGPCAGKSTALQHLQHEGEWRGIEVIAIKEVASRLFLELGKLGLDVSLLLSHPPTHLHIHKIILRSIIEQLQDAQENASTNALIVIDRPDIRAYVSDVEYATLLASLGRHTSPSNEFVDRMIYIRSLAYTNEAAYEAHRGSNPVRTETLEQARQRCDATLRYAREHADFWPIAEPNKERMLAKIAGLAFGVYGPPPEDPTNNLVLV